MVIEPDILLMDEPLGALDRQLRREVQLEIRRLHVAAPRTTLYVTHDQEEALVMSDRIAVMQAGRIVQTGSAPDLYERPVNSFVARFLGESNLLTGAVVRTDGAQAWLQIEGFPGLVEGHAAPGLAPGQTAAALIRPEMIQPGLAGIAATLQERIYLGELVSLRYRLPGGQMLWCRQLAGTPTASETTTLAWTAGRVRILPESTQP
jgi:ABC-type Fe3+/spermidine/putrescine transport system ATPase subunit